MALNKGIFDIFVMNVPTKLDKILVLSIMALSIKFDTQSHKGFGTEL